jgi:hypothetical protein
MENIAVSTFWECHDIPPRATQAMELLISNRNDGQYLPITHTLGVLRQYLSYPNRIVSLVYEDQLSEPQEEYLKPLDQNKIRRIKVDAGLNTLQHFSLSNEISVAEYLAQKNVSYDGV